MALLTKKPLFTAPAGRLGIQSLPARPASVKASALPRVRALCPTMFSPGTHDPAFFACRRSRRQCPQFATYLVLCSPRERWAQLAWLQRCCWGWYRTCSPLLLRRWEKQIFSGRGWLSILLQSITQPMHHRGDMTASQPFINLH